MEGPLPSALAAPSIWKALLATPQRKFLGKRADNVSRELAVFIVQPVGIRRKVLWRSTRGAFGCAGRLADDELDGGRGEARTVPGEQIQHRLCGLLAENTDGLPHTGERRHPVRGRGQIVKAHDRDIPG